MDTKRKPNAHIWSFADIHGIRVHYRELGPTDAPTVVLFHHFHGNVATWRKLQPLLADAYHVVAFDRPGFGFTERRPPRGSRTGHLYSRLAGARLAFGLMNLLHVERATFVGASAGGTVALEAFAYAPHRVNAISLINPAITGDVGPPAALRPLLRIWPIPAVGGQLAARIGAQVGPERVGRSWHDPRAVTESDVAAYQAPMRHPQWGRALFDAMVANPPPDIRGLLRRVDVPALVIAGESDPLVLPEWNAATAAAIQGAQLVRLSDVGHTPHEERPDLVAPVLLEFLRSLS
ncbi:MAG: alpha/beta hydrolase [Nitriliruptoraceae bacterium]